MVEWVQILSQTHLCHPSTTHQSANYLINTSSNALSESQPTIPKSTSHHSSESQSKISKSWLPRGQNLKVCVINPRSLVNKLSKFQSLAYSSPSVISVTETWLSQSILNNEILPNGYSIFRKDHSSCGGGILLAIARHLPTHLLPSPTEIEALIVQILLSPPPSTFLWCMSLHLLMRDTGYPLYNISNQLSSRIHILL